MRKEQGKRSRMVRGAKNVFFACSPTVLLFFVYAYLIPKLVSECYCFVITNLLFLVYPTSDLGSSVPCHQPHITTDKVCVELQYCDQGTVTFKGYVNT